MLDISGTVRAKALKYLWHVAMHMGVFNPQKE